MLDMTTDEVVAFEAARAELESLYPGRSLTLALGEDDAGNDCWSATLAPRPGHRGGYMAAHDADAAVALSRLVDWARELRSGQCPPSASG